MIWYDIRKFYHMISYDIIWHHMTSISYDIIIWYDIRKFAQNKQTNTQTDKQTENSITEATLIPCGSSGGAGQLWHIDICYYINLLGSTWILLSLKFRCGIQSIKEFEFLQPTLLIGSGCSPSHLGLSGIFIRKLYKRVLNWSIEP